jgi:hypothetical protein
MAGNLTAAPRKDVILVQWLVAVELYASMVSQQLASAIP